MEADEVRKHLTAIASVLKVHEGNLQDMAKDLSAASKTLAHLKDYFYENKPLQKKIEKLRASIDNLPYGWDAYKGIQKIFDFVFFDILPKVKDPE